MNQNKLKSEIKSSTIDYAIKNSLGYKTYDSAIVFSNIEDNFHPKSFKNIQQNPNWISRLNKRHSQVKGALEMQSSNSSDALLMNIFCHPEVSKWLGLNKLLNVNDLEITGFGINPVILRSGKPETTPTEIDLILNNSIICESKLTEDTFTNKNRQDIEKYDHFNDLFYKSFLKGTQTEFENYQLIRNILSLLTGYIRFILFCDERRSDLIVRLYETIGCIKDITLRSKCSVITWQQIASVVGTDLKSFLAVKYGIIG